MSQPKRRLIVVSSRFPFATQEAYLSTELQELRGYFSELTVAPVRSPKARFRHAVPGGVEILDWSLLSRAVLSRAARITRMRPARVFRAVARVIASRDPGRLRNIAVIPKALALADWVLENRYDHIHAYWTSTPATVAMVASEVSNVKWSATAHRWDIYERNAFDVKQQNVAFIRAISQRGATDVRSRMPHLNGRLFQLGLGITVASTMSQPPRSSEFRIVCPAALVHVKGHATLLCAVARLRDLGVPIRCELYGTGPLKGELAELAIGLGIDGIVEFTGFVPQEQLHEAYRSGRFAAVVLSSRSAGEAMMEGLPSTILEAMAYAVPVVATDSGSISEVLDNRSGRLVPPDDPQALAGALLDVYREPAAAQARARHAFEIVSSRHDVRTQMRHLAAAIYGKE